MESLSSWFALHSQLAGLAVFLISLAESLAVVGLLVPGVAMMFAAGAFIGSGALEFGPICAWAIAGAIAGDGLSFWLGQHFRERLPSLRPFRSQPDMLERGEAFFHRYGGRSIVFGRFVGPVRAVIPLVAGMMAMPPRRFLLVNVLSALLWGPAYLLPGMAFGASLDVASQVTSRLVTLLILLLAGLWFTAWSSKHLYGFLQPRAHRMILFTFDLCKRHPLLGRLAAPLIDPQQRDYPGLMVWALALLGLSVLLSPLVGLDQWSVSLQPIRTPWSDHGLTLIAALGGSRTLAVLGAAVALWLALEQRNIALAHWLTAAGFALVLAAATRWIPGPDSPFDLSTLWGTICYGFLAVLLADEIERRPWRWLVYTSATVLAGTLGFCSIYFGFGTLSKVAFSWLIAMVWLVLLGVAYRRHSDYAVRPRGLIWVTVAALAAMTALESRRHSLADFEHTVTAQTLAREDWLRTGWMTLPDHRAQMFGPPSQALEIQWAASSAELRRALTAAGWQAAIPPTWSTALNGLNSAATLDQLPVLPHFNQASIDQLRMIKRESDGHWLILRFWDSGHRLQDTSEPIWLASCGLLEERQLFRAVRYSRQQNASRETVGRVAREIGEGNRPYQVIPLTAGGRSAWLLWASASVRESVSP